MTPEELRDFLVGRLGDHVVAAEISYGDLTVTLDAEGYVRAAELCRDELACDFFDCSFGVDERDQGFAVVTILYSTSQHHRVILRHLCAGGRERPVAPSLTHLYPGADWMERETWDMFGIEFEGHPGLAPRLLCPENFEGWPLRKDFFLATREAKPWPGIKEPVELDEEGKPIERIPGPGDAPGPTVLDELMAAQAKRAAGVATAVAPPATEPTGAETAPPRTDDDRAAEARERAERARQKAAEARRRRAEERAAEPPPEEGQ